MIEKIIFIQIKTPDGEMRIEADGFPERIGMTIELLRLGVIATVDDAGMILIHVDNGWAKYKLAKVQEFDFGITLERIFD